MKPIKLIGESRDLTEAIDKLIRGRIQIQRQNPFFAYLSLFLKFKECKNLPEWAGAGISPDGTFSYKKEFIEKLNDEEIIGVITHEVLHLSLLHLLRRKNRDTFKWNISADTTANQILHENHFTLPDGCIMPDNNEITIFGQQITDINKKTTEEIYDELKFPDGKCRILLKGSRGRGKGDDGDGDDDGCNGFDEHFENKADGSKLTDEEVAKLEHDWLNKVEEAYVTAKLKGDVPLGIERLIGKLHENKINWRSLLQRYIQSYIPQDYTYAKPNKKSISAGCYMPNTTKERISVIVGIDTSGSIGQEELVDFLSEIVGMARGFRTAMSIRVITHDIDVYNDYLAENGSAEKIKNIQIKGGGGTSHKPILEYIKAKYRDTSLVIFLTDGESDLQDIKFEDYKFDKIFVISKEGNDGQLKGKRCRVLSLK